METQERIGLSDSHYRQDEAVTRSNLGIVVVQTGINYSKSISLMPKRRAEITSQCGVELINLVSGCRQR